MNPIRNPCPGLHSSTSKALVSRTRIPVNPRTPCQESNSNADILVHPYDHQRTASRREVARTVLMGTLGMAAMLLGPCPSSRAALLDEEVSTRVFEMASPSVVSIVNYKTQDGVLLADGIGTGVVWDKLGHIATNYHVISKVDKSMIPLNTKVVVTDNDGMLRGSFGVELVGSDAMHDLAVLRIVPEDEMEIQSLLPIMMGSSSDIQVGQFVFAIGNTFGLTKTLSAGIVSGLNRTIPSPVGTRIYGAVQTDASINAGNSGGPLLDSAGRMVGMNISTVSRQGVGRGSGVNFSLPADLLRDIVPKLIVYGNASGMRV